MRPSFSLRGLFAAVLTLGVGCAALASPSDWWASGLFSVMLLVLAVAAVAAMLSRGSTRAAMVGATWLGCAYSVCTYGPWFDTHVSPRLLTSRMAECWFDYLKELAQPPNVPGAVSTEQTPEGKWRVRLADGTMLWMGSDVPRSETLAAIVHSLAALLFALLGGFVGQWFYGAASLGTSKRYHGAVQ